MTRPQQITEIRIDLRRVFDRACARTLEAVKAVPEATPEGQGLSVDEWGWAESQLIEARSWAARALHRLSKRVKGLPQAEQTEEMLVFRVVCSTPLQAGLLPEAVERFLTLWIAAAWFRLHSELNVEIDMERELAELNRMTLWNDGAERPYHF